MEHIKKRYFKISAIVLWGIVAAIFHAISSFYIDAMFINPIEVDITNTHDGRYKTAVTLLPSTQYGYVEEAEFDYARRSLFINGPSISINFNKPDFLEGDRAYKITSRWIKKSKVMYMKRYFGSFTTPEDGPVFILEGRAPRTYKNHKVYLFKEVNETYFNLSTLTGISAAIMTVLLFLFLIQETIMDLKRYFLRMYRKIF
jgi:hypothetical protein